MAGTPKRRARALRRRTTGTAPLWPCDRPARGMSAVGSGHGCWRPPEASASRADSSRCSSSYAQPRGRGLPQRRHSARTAPPACFTEIGRFAFGAHVPLHGCRTRRTARVSPDAPGHEAPLTQGRAQRRPAGRRRRSARPAPLDPRRRPRSPDRSTVTRPHRSSGLSAEASHPDPARATTSRYVAVRRSMWRMSLQNFLVFLDQLYQEGILSRKHYVIYANPMKETLKITT